MGKQDMNQTSPMKIPISMRGWPRWVVYFLSLIGVVYLLNPTAGLLEIIPDFAPFIGNLDEGVAVWLLFSGMIELFGIKKTGEQFEVLTSDRDIPVGLLPAGDARFSDKSENNIAKK